MKKYFIDITWYVAKNNLEERLQSRFECLEHTIIPENKLKELINDRYETVVSEYRSGKGRAAAFFDSTGLDDTSIQYNIGTSTVLHLTMIRGEL